MDSNKKVVGFLLPKEDLELLRKVTKQRGECVSSFVRRSIYESLARLSYLDEGSKKALGVSSDGKKREAIEHGREETGA